MNGCPSGAISAAKDEYRFSIPLVNRELCTRCGLCEKHCDCINPVKKNMPLKVFAGISMNPATLNISTSGGVFAECAAKILEQGGVVYGCAFLDNFTAAHIRIKHSDDIKRLQGSKYVQSNIGTIFRSLYDDLKNGKPVLFSGTPCQAATARHITGDHDYLFTVEIVCHGVPNQDFFNDYLAWESKKNAGNIVEFIFRDKSLKWRSGAGSMRFQSKNGKIHRKKLNVSNSYYYCYYINNRSIYRDSCYQCPYAEPRRCADLTIGDYWGVELFHPEIDTKGGVSAVLVNTAKGNALLEGTENAIRLYESKLEYVQKYNNNLSRPTKPVHRDVMQIWIKTGVSGIVQNLHIPMMLKLKETMKNIIPNSLVKCIRRIKFLVENVLLCGKG
jgi:coenzyme F420-reducing hydrogenase beta subunit